MNLMTREEAQRAAVSARAEFGVPKEAHVDSAPERRFIELAGSDPAAAEPVCDLLAWIIRFRSGIAWIDLTVDDATGEIVRVERSRSWAARVRT